MIARWIVTRRVIGKAGSGYVKNDHCGLKSSLYSPADGPFNHASNTISSPISGNYGGIKKRRTKAPKLAPVSPPTVQNENVPVPEEPPMTPYGNSPVREQFLF